MSQSAQTNFFVVLYIMKDWNDLVKRGRVNSIYPNQCVIKCWLFKGFLWVYIYSLSANAHLINAFSWLKYH